MRPHLHISATGKGFLLLVLSTLALLGLTALIFGPMPALGAGLGVIVGVRGLWALLSPSE